MWCLHSRITFRQKTHFLKCKDMRVLILYFRSKETTSASPKMMWVRWILGLFEGNQSILFSRKSLVLLLLAKPACVLSLELTASRALSTYHKTFVYLLCHPSRACFDLNAYFVTEGLNTLLAKAGSSSKLSRFHVHLGQQTCGHMSSRGLCDSCQQFFQQKANLLVVFAAST